MATITDVAKAAGVSPITVSRVFRNGSWQEITFDTELTSAGLSQVLAGYDTTLNPVTFTIG